MRMNLGKNNCAKVVALQILQKGGLNEIGV